VKKVQNFDDNHSGSYAASFMSKAPEIVQQTENGATCFDSLYTENIILPQPVNLKEQGKSAKHINCYNNVNTGDVYDLI